MVLKKLNIQPGESVCVIGGGPIGLIFVQILHAAGASPIIVSEPDKFRREVAKKCGADITIDPLQEDISTIVNSKTASGVDAVIEVVGSQLPTAIEVVRKGGRILLFGFNTKAEPAVTQHKIILKEITIIGSWIAKNTFPAAINILEKKILNLEMLITHELALENILQGIEALKTGKGIEIIIKP